jgi:hypothetical protein
MGSSELFIYYRDEGKLQRAMPPLPGSITFEFGLEPDPDQIPSS